MFVVQFPRWGRADAEIKRPHAGNPEQSQILPFQLWRRFTYSCACIADCMGIFLSSFCLPRSFCFFFFSSKYSSNKKCRVDYEWNRLLLMVRFDWRSPSLRTHTHTHTHTQKPTHTHTYTHNSLTLSHTYSPIYSLSFKHKMYKTYRHTHTAWYICDKCLLKNKTKQTNKTHTHKKNNNTTTATNKQTNKIRSPSSGFHSWTDVKYQEVINRSWWLCSSI